MIKDMYLTKSQRGFSLIQGLLLAAILAGSGLVATRLLTDQKLTMRSAETRDQIEQLHRLVYSTLQNKEHCTATFITFGGGTAVLNTNVDAIRTSNGQTIVQRHSGSAADLSKSYMNGNVTVTRITVSNNIDIPGHAQFGDTNFGVVRINYQRHNKDQNVRTKEGYGAKDIQKSFLVRLQRDPLITPPPLASCYAVTENDGTSEEGNKDLNKELCEQLNSGEPGVTTSFFIWDEANSTCKPKNNVCRNAGEVNTGINSNGEVECRRIVDWMDTGRLFEQSTFDSQPTCPPGSTVSLDLSGGKVKLVCTGGGGPGGGPGGCVPSCPGSGSYCLGYNYGAPDGCGGTCVGTNNTGGACIAGVIEDPPLCGCQDPSTVCAGEVYNDSCGNPVCTGTKLSGSCISLCFCENPGNHCSGTTYADSCGNPGACTGTKTTGACGLVPIGPIDPGPLCYNGCFAAGYNCTLGAGSSSTSPFPYGNSVKGCSLNQYYYCAHTSELPSSPMPVACLHEL